MFAHLHIGSPAPRWRKLGVQGRHEGSQGSAVGSPGRSEPCQASRLEGGLGRPDCPAPRSAPPPPPDRAGRGLAGASSERRAEGSGPQGSSARAPGRWKARRCACAAGTRVSALGASKGPRSRLGSGESAAPPPRLPGPRKRTGSRLPAAFFFFFKRYSFSPLLPSLTCLKERGTPVSRRRVIQGRPL